MIEVETPEEIIVDVVEGTVVESTGNVDAEVVSLDDLAITVAKREYVITGDNIYVPMLYDDAPQWMKDLVELAVAISMETANADSLARLAEMLTEFATSYVPLNQYTQSILDLSNADQSMHLMLTTLNSNFNDGLSVANSQIIHLESTKASRTEVVAQVIDTLAAQLALPGSDLQAVIARLDQAIVTERQARAQSFQVLTSSLNNVNEGVTANSTAITNLETSVSNVNGNLTAQAGQITQLRTDLTSEAGNRASGDTQVTNTLNTTISNGLTNVESRWAYNSTLRINGVYKKSGFGLTTNYSSGSGTVGDPYVSEFWIDASRMKFTNSNQTGGTAPFTIDASGATPQVTFNGKVSFTNVTDTTSLTNSISAAQTTANTANSNALARTLPSEVAAAVNSNTTTIDGAKITTGSIAAAQIATGSITAGLIDANAISGKTISGGVITGTNIYGANIEGSVIKASFIDLTSTATLTNWQQYNSSNYPSQYASNFAHKNDGSLLVDSLGYVRLMGNTNIVTTAVTYSNDYVPNSNSTPAVSIPLYDINLHGYDDYKYSSLNRMIKNTSTLSIGSSQQITIGSLQGIAHTGSSCTCTLKFYVFEDYYELYLYGSQTSQSSWSSVNGYIKKNSVTVASTTDPYSSMTYTIDILGISFTLSGRVTSIYGGMGISAVSTNSLPTSTVVTCTSKYDSMLRVIEGYCSARMNVTVNVPAITVT